MIALAPGEDRPDWTRLKSDWPNSAYSSFVQAADMLWHVQLAGSAKAPKILLLHGTGASTHSFADSFQHLAKDHHILAVDLPGHGFSASVPASKLSLTGMAKAIGTLLNTLGFQPSVCIGHSAGAAVGLEMVLQGSISPDAIVGFNAALKPIEGNMVLAPLAKVLFVNPFTPRLFSMQARYTNTASNLLQATNSPVNDQSRKNYRILMENPAHVSGALGMMANWKLQPLIERLAQISCPVHLVVAKDDKMVPPSVSKQAVQRIRNGHYIPYETGGHLLHEVRPELVVNIAAQLARPETQNLQETG